MKVVLYTNSVSAHQLPLAREIVRRVGGADFRYIYTEAYFQRGAQEVDCQDAWVINENTNKRESQEWLESCDILLSSNRALELFNRRAALGLKTYYQSERWFKPVEIGVGGRCRCMVDGRIRMLVPRYRRMAKGFVRWLDSDPNARYLAIGPWAKKDMLRIGVRADKIVDWGYFVEPSSHVCNSPNCTNGEGLSSASVFRRNAPTGEQRPLRILYIGRLLALKRVDTIIRAVALANARLKSKVEVEERTGLRSVCWVGPCRGGENGDGRAASMMPPHRDESGALIERALPKSNDHSSTSDFDTLSPSPPLHGYTLTIVGDGPEKERLQKIASTVDLNLQPQPFFFLPSVPIHEVRSIMRRHDVLVFASNAMDGWGAVVSEALAEGVPVIGTYETGASAALLPDSQLFHCGDYRELAHKLSALHLHLPPTPSSYTSSSLHLHLPPTPPLSTLPPAYTPSGAADRLLNLHSTPSTPLHGQSLQ